MVATATCISDAVARVIFSAQDSRFVILALESGLAAVGELASPMVGERVKLYGETVVHPRFGKQFKFTRFERLTPVGNDAVRAYLVDTAKWVGPAVADRLLWQYKDKTLEILKTDPDRVARETKGITAKRAAYISEQLRGREKEERLALELGALLSGKVPDNVAKAAASRWAENAPAIIREDPYILATIHGCGFAGADRVAAGLGITGADARRLAAALEYAVRTAAGRYGHTRVDCNEAEIEASKLAGVTLTAEGIAKAVGQTLDRGDTWYALTKLAAAEQSIAGHLRRLETAARELPHAPVDMDGCAEDQRAAVHVCLGAGVSLLVGPPGTGKTWTLARIVAAYSAEAGNRVALAAPTGKAAKRMSESLAGNGLAAVACTIHRLLDPSKAPDGEDGESRFRFSRGESNPIDADLLVIDETSMLDVSLAASLFAAVPSGCRVILVGDDHQLPSVGPGAVLRDLLAAGLPTARLTEIKRNAGEIVRACHAIKDGKALKPVDKPLDLEAGHNWRHIELGGEKEIAEQIVWLVTEWAAKRGIPAEAVTVVSPFNHLNQRGLSCRDFNERLQAALNPPRAGEEKARGGIRERDRVVRLSNGIAKSDLDESIDVPVVNGDLGRVERIDKRHIVVTFENPERRVRLIRGEADLALAYALSCHKMQGSEARVVVVPMHRSFGIFPNREWVYTAFSRARETLLTVGTAATLGSWVRRQTCGLRQTELREYLCAGAQSPAVKA